MGPFWEPKTLWRPNVSFACLIVVKILLSKVRKHYKDTVAGLTLKSNLDLGWQVGSWRQKLNGFQLVLFEVGWLFPMGP